MISTFPTPSDGRLRNADVEGTTFVDNGVDHTPTRPNAHTCKFQDCLPTESPGFILVGVVCWYKTL